MGDKSIKGKEKKKAPKSDASKKKKPTAFIPEVPATKVKEKKKK